MISKLFSTSEHREFDKKEKLCIEKLITGKFCTSVLDFQNFEDVFRVKILKNVLFFIFQFYLRPLYSSTADALITADFCRTTIIIIIARQTGCATRFFVRTIFVCASPTNAVHREMAFLHVCRQYT